MRCTGPVELLTGLLPSRAETVVFSTPPAVTVSVWVAAKPASL
jgi:hypothetical protein